MSCNFESDMAQPARKIAIESESERPDQSGRTTPLRNAYQAFRILQFAFVLLPLIAGLDKYFHLLTNWEQYLSPIAMKILGPHGSRIFMHVDGAIEIIVGIGVAIRPKIFAYVVSAWLLGIVINLLTTGHFYDIVLRDFTLSVSAFALGRLAPSRTTSS